MPFSTTGLLVGTTGSRSRTDRSRVESSLLLPLELVGERITPRAGELRKSGVYDAGWGDRYATPNLALAYHHLDSEGGALPALPVNPTRRPLKRPQIALGVVPWFSGGG